MEGGFESAIEGTGVLCLWRPKSDSAEGDMELSGAKVGKVFGDPVPLIVELEGDIHVAESDKPGDDVALLELGEAVEPLVETGDDVVMDEPLESGDTDALLVETGEDVATMVETSDGVVVDPVETGEDVAPSTEIGDEVAIDPLETGDFVATLLETGDFVAEMVKTGDSVALLVETGDEVDTGDSVIVDSLPETGNGVGKDVGFRAGRTATSKLESSTGALLGDSV